MNTVTHAVKVRGNNWTDDLMHELYHWFKLVFIENGRAMACRTGSYYRFRAEFEDDVEAAIDFSCKFRQFAFAFKPWPEGERKVYLPIGQVIPRVVHQVIVLVFSMDQEVLEAVAEKMRKRDQVAPGSDYLFNLPRSH